MKDAATLIGSVFLALAVVRPLAMQPARTRLALELQDYSALPVTAANTNTNTRAQLARVNYMRDEPGGRRFFVNDLNGPLYILDKQKKTFATYLNFNGRGGRPGLFPKFTFELNFATGRTRPRRRPVRRGQRRRALPPDEAGRRDQEGRRCPGDDCTSARRDRADVEYESERHQSASRQHHKSRGADVRVDCRRETGVRRQLRRLSRQPGPGCRQGRHHDFHPRGAEG